MRLLLSLALLGLAWFTAVNIIATAFAWLWGRALLQRKERPGADLLAVVRLAPSVVATLFVLAVFLPGHVWFEPSESDESFGVLVMTFALGGLVLVLRSMHRLAAVARVARRAKAAVAIEASPLVAAGGTAEAYELREFRGLSLAGVFRPRILVGARVRRALTPDELDLAISHELAHRSSRDNVKRCAMFCAPDLFGCLPLAHALELRWRAETECRADSRAVAGDERRAVLLASALVKVARLAGQPGPLSSAVWSTFHEPALLETRIRRLVSGAALVSPSRQVTVPLALGISVALALVASSLGGAADIHRVTEALVGLLP